MSDDKSDFIGRMENTWRNWRGEDWTPEKAVENFTLYGPARRAQALDEFDAELRDDGGPISSNPNDLRRAAELRGLRSKLDEVHHNLRKVNR